MIHKTQNPNLKPAAQKLRRDMTREERRLWYDFLKTFRSELSDAKDPGICYSRILNQLEETFKLELEGNLLTTAQCKNKEWLFQNLKKEIPENGQTPKEAFTRVKNAFDLQLNLLEETELAAGIALEHAFDFMEEAFAAVRKWSYLLRI